MFMQLVKRGFAFIIDFIILSAIFYGNAVFVLASMGNTEQVNIPLATYAFMILLQIIYVVIYFVYLPVRMEGQTVGKKLLNIKEVKLDGSHLTVSDYFKRDVMLKFLLMTMSGGFVLILNVILLVYQVIKRQELQALHDIIMKTKVISTKA